MAKITPISVKKKEVIDHIMAQMAHTAALLAVVHEFSGQ